QVLATHHILWLGRHPTPTCGSLSTSTVRAPRNRHAPDTRATKPGALPAPPARPPGDGTRGATRVARAPALPRLQFPPKRRLPASRPGAPFTLFVAPLQAARSSQSSHPTAAPMKITRLFTRTTERPYEGL